MIHRNLFGCFGVVFRRDILGDLEVGLGGRWSLVMGRLGEFRYVRFWAFV